MPFITDFNETFLSALSAPFWGLVDPKIDALGARSKRKFSKCRLGEAKDSGNSYVPIPLRKLIGAGRAGGLVRPAPVYGAGLGRPVPYQIDPALWVKEVLGVEPADWQKKFLRAPRGASIVVLTARQVGKTTVAGWAIAHFMHYNPGSLSLIACPTLRQSAEAVRRVEDALLKAGVKLKVDNVFAASMVALSASTLRSPC